MSRDTRTSLHLVQYEIYNKLTRDLWFFSFATIEVVGINKFLSSSIDFTSAGEVLHIELTSFEIAIIYSITSFCADSLNSLTINRGVVESPGTCKINTESYVHSYGSNLYFKQKA
jgi:hypothetical protein